MLWAFAVAIPCTHILSYALLSPEHASTTRWWLMHVFCNLIVMYAVWPDLVETTTNPRMCAYSTSRHVSLFGMGVHAYHAVVFPMSADDKMHHLLFAAILGAMTASYPSRASNAMLFFLSGLPGALIYTLLVARRCNRLRHIHEPIFSAGVNVFIRLVGILHCLVQFIASVNALPIDARPPTVIAILQCLLCLGNGVYYTHQSVTRAFRRRRNA